MVGYVVLFVASCMAAVGEMDQKRNILLQWKSRSITLHTEVCIPLLLFLFLGIFRETSVGFDAQNYYFNYWGQIEFLTWKQLLSDFSMDNGFYLVLKLISVFTEDWWIARAVLFVLTFMLFYFVIREYSPYPSLSLIIFLGIGMLSLTFGILRQALAGAVTMIGYVRLRNRSWFKCLLYIMIAATIHKTAVLCVFMLMLYIMNEKNFSATKIIAISIAVYGLFFVGIPLVTAFYSGGEYYGIAASNGGYMKLLFIIITIALIMHLFRITETFQDTELSYLFNLSCATLFVQVGALQWSLITRSVTFFSIYWCILIPKLISKLPRYNRFLYFVIVTVLFGVLFFSQIAEVERFVMHQF